MGPSSLTGPSKVLRLFQPMEKSGLYLICPKHNVYAANRSEKCVRCSHG